MVWSAGQARIVAAQAAAEHAGSVVEQVVRDEINGGYVNRSAAARALAGDPDRADPPRGRVHAIMDRSSPVPQTSRPAWPVLVYLRGAGVAGDQWVAIEQALWARGWSTTRRRGSAWHASRTDLGLVVLVDVSVVEPDTIVVALVRARADETDPARRDLPVILGGRIPAPRIGRVFDTDAIAAAVRDLLVETKGVVL